MTDLSNKELVIIGGANGSGKTTFAFPYVEKLGYDFLNADEIAKELEKQGYSHALVRAGKVFFTRLAANLKEGQSFVVETTLSGSYINKVAKKAQLSGYRIRLIYIFLDSPELCVERVKTRVLKGGHDVPIDAIVRRFYRSKRNFWDNFTTISDDWVLFYNGGDGFQQVAVGTGTEYSVANDILFTKFLGDLQ